jgi:hypothetical protein
LQDPGVKRWPEFVVHLQETLPPSMVGVRVTLISSEVPTEAVLVMVTAPVDAT